MSLIQEWKKKLSEILCRIVGLYKDANKKNEKSVIYRRDFPILLAVFLALSLLLPAAGYGSVESTLTAIQGKLIGTILPLVAILGIVFAACSFAFGSENARRHAMLAVIGALIGFGAPAIIQFIRGLVQ